MIAFCHIISNQVKCREKWDVGLTEMTGRMCYVYSLDESSSHISITKKSPHMQLTWAFRCSSSACSSSRSAFSEPSLASLLLRNLTKDGKIFDPLSSQPCIDSSKTIVKAQLKMHSKLATQERTIMLQKKLGEGDGNLVSISKTIKTTLDRFYCS